MSGGTAGQVLGETALAMTWVDEHCRIGKQRLKAAKCPVWQVSEEDGGLTRAQAAGKPWYWSQTAEAAPFLACQE